MGLGHAIRCLALAHMLKPDFPITFICKEIPDEVKLEVENAGFFVQLIMDEIAYIEKLTSADLLILDGYHFDLNYQKKLKEKNVLLIWIDDLHEQETVADMIINHAPGIEAKDYLMPENTQLLAGSNYVLLRPSFLEQAKQKRQIQQVKTVLICFGGADALNLTERALKVVMSNQQLLKINVITGASYAFESSLASLLQVDSRVEYYHAINEHQMLQLMSESDIAIVPSSGILNEVLAAGCQVVSGMYTENQQHIYGAYKALNCFFDAQQFATTDLINALNLAYKGQPNLTNPIDGNSGERIKKAIMELIQKRKEFNWRNVSVDDLSLLYEWANDPVVRANAINQDAIAWEDHVNWFHTKLNSPNSQLFILEKLNVPIGQVRIDFDGVYWVIGYSIDMKFRGLGYGKMIIAELMKRCENKKLKAVVKSGNISSRKVFEGLEFIEKSEVKQDNTLVEYYWEYLNP